MKLSLEIVRMVEEYVLERVLQDLILMLIFWDYVIMKIMNLLIRNLNPF